MNRSAGILCPVFSIPANQGIGDLKQKTIDTLVFIREFLLYGQNPLLQEHQVELMMRLRQHYSIICDYFSTNSIFSSFIIC